LAIGLSFTGLSLSGGLVRFGLFDFFAEEVHELVKGPLLTFLVHVLSTASWPLRFHIIGVRRRLDPLLFYSAMHRYYTAKPTLVRRSGRHVRKSSLHTFSTLLGCRRFQKQIDKIDCEESTHGKILGDGLADIGSYGVKRDYPTDRLQVSDRFVSVERRHDFSRKRRPAESAGPLPPRNAPI
jgi:hypothetical protein